MPHIGVLVNAITNSIINDSIDCYVLGPIRESILSSTEWGTFELTFDDMAENLGSITAEPTHNTILNILSYR